MATNLKLPDRTTFTKEQLANRWKCDISLIDSYIGDGILRQAIDTSRRDYDYWNKFKYFVVDDVEGFCEMINSFDDKNPQSVADAESKMLENLLDCPRFLYILHSLAVRKIPEPSVFNLVRKMFSLGKGKFSDLSDFKDSSLIPMKKDGESWKVVHIREPRARLHKKSGRLGEKMILSDSVP